MFTSLFGIPKKTAEQKPKEGELYKNITAFGETFAIYYGYYEEGERYSKYPEPVEVFPNFLKNPQYTKEGYPFATAIQLPCEHFKKVKDLNDRCGDCAFYRQGEELIGICIHETKRSKAEEK